MSKKAKAQIIYTDGRVVDTAPANGKDFKLDELQKIVGGYIQIVSLPNRKQYLVVNEEGKMHGLPVNDTATGVYCLAFQPFGDIIVGDALLCDVSLIK